MPTATDVLRWPTYSVRPICSTASPSGEYLGWVPVARVDGPPPGLGCARPRADYARQQAKLGVGWLLALFGLVAYAGLWQLAEWALRLARWIVGGW